MTATRTPPAAARLAWRQHDYPGGGYVRTAVCRDGSVICETFLSDHGQAGPGIEMWQRAVCIPAPMVSAVLAGLAGDTEAAAVVRAARQAEAAGAS